MKFFVVIPAHNEENTIARVISGIRKCITNIVVINDASSDKTGMILKKLPVHVISNPHNMGYVKSLERGLLYAFKKNADYVITFDADGQHKQTDLPHIISVIRKESPDFVLCKRAKKNRFAESLFGLYSKLRYGFSDPLCGLRAYKKEIFYIHGRALEHKYTIGTELMFRAIKSGATFKEISIKTNRRKDSSRFGDGIIGNLRELHALLNVLSI